MSPASSIQQNLFPANPGLADALNLLKKDILLSLNAHHIGTVQEFDADKQTVKATINYKKTFFTLDAKSGQYVPRLIDYPVLTDCPAIILGGGGGALTFPIEAGDECLILFNDRDLDNWFAGASGGALATPRLHSFSDGVALVGLRSLANVLTNYDTDRVALRGNKAGTTIVAVGEDKVKVANALFNLNSLLQELVTEIQSLVAQTALITVTPGSLVGPSSPPLNAAAISAISVTLASTAIKISGLLE